MDNESKAHHLRPEKLARLWDIGSDAYVAARDSVSSSEDRYAELLHDWMARQLPPDPVQTQDLMSLLPDALGRICQEVRPFSGDSIGFLLTHADTDVQVLRRIKDYAKEWGASPAGEVEREAALALYFAAIAAALVFHGVQISKHSDRTLRSSFETLSERNAVPSELRSLFRKVCRRSP